MTLLLAALLLVAFVLHEATLAPFGAASFDLMTRDGEAAARSLLDVRLEEREQWLRALPCRASTTGAHWSDGGRAASDCTTSSVCSG